MFYAEFNRFIRQLQSNQDRQLRFGQLGIAVGLLDRMNLFFNLFDQFINVLG